ncbi:BTAD domain-containing putative transcriptional regulator [Actinomadura sp. NPDC048955]|uniref:BTAD domain-containing putative transcriptional regulator n=1 Tax=Actinomadura sp. NPDC048955 TaxID=3158228 RepID=UPI0033CF0CBF
MQVTVLNGIHVQEGSGARSLQPLVSAVLLALVVEGDAGPVPADRLMNLVWGDGADKRLLHQAMYKLRGALGSERIGGDRATDTYQFTPQPGDRVDLWSWRELVETCAQRSASDPHAAVLLWERTLHRWPDSGLRGLPATSEMKALISNLHAERLSAVEQQAEVQLQLGLHARASTSLPPLVARWWRREHLRGLLMTALYRSHRGPDALSLYTEYRERLQREIRGEPGRALQRLAQQINVNDAALLEVTPPDLPPADRAVIDSGADTSGLSVARMCVAILDDRPAETYTTALDRASCSVVKSMRGWTQLEEENRDFGNRLVRAAILKYDIVRILELGALPPAWYSAHKTAHLARPDACVVYANRDPALAQHSAVQLRDVENAEFVHGSVLAPARILQNPAVAALLQLDKPLEEREPVIIIDRHELNSTSGVHDLRAAYGLLCDQLTRGSLFSVTGPTPEGLDPGVREYVREIFGAYPTPDVVEYRTGQQMVELVPEGWEVLPPSPSDSFRFWPEPGPAGRRGPWRQNSVVAIKR